MRLRHLVLAKSSTIPAEPATSGGVHHAFRISPEEFDSAIQMLGADTDAEMNHTKSFHHEAPPNERRFDKRKNDGGSCDRQ